jgi:uroporphyrinogen III methyltransferase/synthase
LFLHEQGVRFEVVPGVPAGIAVPSYAGVPVTYPGGGDTLTFVRGHEDDGKTRASVDWSSLARLDGTIVCYAGAQQLPHLLSALVAHGRPPDDSAAIVYDGTLPTQETVTGSLDQVARSAKQSNDRRPAILIVGRVAALRDHLRWFDARPLFGKRVLVTRPRDQAAELVERLEAMGAEAIEAPMIRIVPPEDFAPLDDACLKAKTFDWIVFSSANAVDSFIARLLATPNDLRALGPVKLCAVGPATAERLATHGLKVDLTPAEYRAESVLHAISESGDVAGLRILLPRADIGRDLLAEELRKRGADVTEVVAYRTVFAEPEREGEPDIYRMLLERRIDVVTFTSASAVRNFVKVLGAEPAADLLRTTVVASIGPVTAEAAVQCNIQTTIVPATFTVPALVDAIVDYFEKQPKTEEVTK